MSKKTLDTPNLNKWLKTFKNVGKATGSAAIEALREQVPTIASVVDSSTELLRDSREFISKTKTQMIQQTTMFDKTKIATDAKNILKNAWEDIKNGEYSLDNIGDDSYDMLEDFDESLGESYDVDEADPSSVAMFESRKNTAILGKAVTQGNIATIEGMKHMTTTLANVNIKTSNVAVSKLSNMMLIGLNQSQTQLNGIATRLDNINANLSAMVSFQNSVTLQSQQAALEYYATSQQMMDTMGKVLSEMQDFNLQTKSIPQKPKQENKDNIFQLGLCNTHQIYDFLYFLKFANYHLLQ